MTRTIDTAECAKMLRKQLKKSFPDTKFSVRTRRYAGGSSLDVKWTDGPTYESVKSVVHPYEGTKFDGMIDMEFGIDQWLLPDGTLVFAGTRGTEGSGGLHEAQETERPEGAERVSTHCYIFCERRKSPALLQLAINAAVAGFGFDPDDFTIGGCDEWGYNVKAKNWQDKDIVYEFAAKLAL